MGRIIYKKREDKILVLNTQSGFWYVGKLDERMKDISEKEFITNKHLNGELYTTLMNEEILREKNPEIEQPFSDKMTLLILDTTKACNLACKYCFVDAQTKGTEMTLDIALKSLELVLNYSKCADTLTVEFSGGEPLVNFRLIKEFVPIALQKAEMHGKNLTFSIQTNGTLLNEEVLDFFMKYNVNIGISVDGTKEFHDKNRVYGDGRGSNEIIVENIKKLQIKGCNTSILAVISSPEQYDSVIEFAQENNISEIRTNLVTKSGRAKGKEEYTIDYEKIADKYIEISKKILEGQIKIRDATLTFFLWNLLLNQPHMCFRSPCGSGTNQISVTSDGEIYPCQGWRNIHDKPICNVVDTTGLEVELNGNGRIRELREHNVRNIEACKLCDWSAFCGVCPREIYTEKGTMNERIGYCNFQAKVFEELMWNFDLYADSIRKYLLGI